MSSYTSSSKRRQVKAEILVWASVIFVLLGYELFVRKVFRRMSSGDRLIADIPKIVDEVSEFPGGRLVFLGDSRTRCSILPEVVEKEFLQITGLNLKAARTHLDSSTMLTWYFSCKNRFMSDPQKKYTLVLQFNGDKLSDQKTANLRNYECAYNFCAVYDLAEGMSYFENFEDKARFGVSHFSASVACHDRLRDRFLTKVIPNYQNGTLKVNDILYRSKQKDNIPTEYTYEWFKKLIQLSEKSKVKLVLVALPQRTPWSIDSKHSDLIRQNKINFIDARNAPVGYDDFDDNAHMNDSGAQKYSKYIAKQLSKNFTNSTK